MADELNFNTTQGKTIARELQISYLNTGTFAEPIWSPVGRRVESSDMEFDWDTNTYTDIFGNKYTDGKKATRTQSFDPWALDSIDVAQKKIWNLAVRDDDIQALLNQDMLIAHFYAGGSENGKENFAERYESCSVLPTRQGGDGGGNISIGIDVTYGGTRTMGKVSRGEDGAITFTPDGNPEIQSYSGYSVSRSTSRLGE